MRHNKIHLNTDIARIIRAGSRTQERTTASLIPLSKWIQLTVIGFSTRSASGRPVATAPNYRQGADDLSHHHQGYKTAKEILAKPLKRSRRQQHHPSFTSRLLAKKRAIHRWVKTLMKSWTTSSQLTEVANRENWGTPCVWPIPFSQSCKRRQSLSQWPWSRSREAVLWLKVQRWSLLIQWMELTHECDIGSTTLPWAWLVALRALIIQNVGQLVQRSWPRHQTWFRAEFCIILTPSRSSWVQLIWHSQQKSERLSVILTKNNSSERQKSNLKSKQSNLD